MTSPGEEENFSFLDRVPFFANLALQRSRPAVSEKSPLVILLLIEILLLDDCASMARSLAGGVREIWR